MKLPLHGSNPQDLYKAFNLPVEEAFLDFSANINPLGPPEGLKGKWAEAFTLVTEYPDPLARRLKRAAAEKDGISPEWILFGNGGAELITLMARMLSGKKVLIIQPAFSEYETACRAENCSIMFHILKEGSWKLDAEEILPKLKLVDAVFLCNPNNPTGRSYSMDSVMKILAEAKKQDCLAIIDEAFHDFLPGKETYAPMIADYPGLIILRSLTKMYAIPGLRLGCLIARPEIIGKIASFQPHWSVNSLALMAGEKCIEDEQHVARTLELVKKERGRLLVFFEKHGFRVSDSKVNFYLLQDTQLRDQLPLLHFLLEKGIVPRHTYNFPGLDGNWLRFAIKRPEENRKLMEVFAEWRRVH